MLTEAGSPTTRATASVPTSPASSSSISPPRTPTDVEPTDIRIETRRGRPTMGFFDALRQMMGATPDPAGEGRTRLAEAWGISDTSHPEFPDGAAPAADPAEMAEPPDPIAYDREQWQRKVHRVLDKLPASREEWDVLLAEGQSLGLDPDWMLRVQVEAFTMLVRRVVADRKITAQEHRKLDLARDLIGMSDDDA